MDSYDHWGSLRRIQGVMEINQRELLEFLIRLRDDTPFATAILAQDLHESVFDEITRLSHNYLSARSMLVERTRDVMDNRYVESPISAELGMKVAELNRTTAAPG